MKSVYAELVGGSRIFAPYVEDEVAAAVQLMADTDDTVFGDPDAAVQLPLRPDVLEVTLKAADLAAVKIQGSIPF